MRIFNKMHRKKWMPALLCLFLICGNLMPLSAVRASAEEEAINQRVKAGVFYFDGYHMKDEEGKLTGYGIEVLQMISQYSHLNFDYVGYDKSWNDMLTMLENGEIDLVTSAGKTPEREAKFAFSYPIGRSSTIISILADNTKYHSGDYQTYNGMCVGLIKGSAHGDRLAEFAKEKKFSYETKEYENLQQLERALKDGSIDAILSTNLRKMEKERTLDTLQTENFYVLVRKEDTELLAEINYAIEQMDISGGDWDNSLYYKYYGDLPAIELIFNEREKAYIQDVQAGKKKITVTSIGDREPYSYTEDGQLKGIMPDYFAEVMKLCGLPYEVIVPENRDDYYNMANTNSVDVVIDRRASGLAAKEDTYRGFNTDSYMTLGTAKVTRNDFKGEIKTIAVANSQGEEPLDKEVIGDAKILHYETRDDALNAVLKGEADAAYVYTYTAQLFVNNDLTGSLQYSIVNGVRFPFQMYIREECDHELVTILSKCLEQMSGDSLNQLITQYTSYTPQNMTFIQYMQVNPEILALLILATVLVLVIILALTFQARSKEKMIHVTEESKRKVDDQLAIVEALSRDFLNIYSINPEEDAAKVIKLEGYVASGLEDDHEKVFPYTPLVQQYIDDRVYPADQQDLIEAMSVDKVCKKLASATEYVRSYRVVIDGEIHNYQFTYVKAEGEHRSQEGFTILLGFRNIDEIVQEEQKQREALTEALAQAQHANHAKTAFLNNMSHDIRTPMNAIIGFTSLAATHLDNMETVRDYLDKIMTSSKHLLSLINDVLDMSRIESGKVSINEEETNLPEIMHDLKTIVQSDIKAKQFEFYMDTVDVTNETIICDKLRLNQVLLNILSNSMKYTKAGGTVSVRVIQTDSDPDGYASYQFRIKDNGIGMSEEFLKHLFEPFEREQTATVSGIQGTGLGLAITKNIIDMMNGSVEVESEMGKGTEFIVSFRFRTAEQPQNTEYLDQLADLRALIVDDDVNTCMSVSKMLSSIGMNPDWATHGKEAIVRTEFAMEENKPYSAYIVDWLMPDMNGIEVVRRIRKVIGDAAPIIILTSYDWADIEAEAKDAGVTAFCSKPLFLSELRQILTAPYMAEQEVTTSEEESQELLLEGKKILLVEDNEINQEIAQEILEAAGLVIDTVSDGTEAVDRIKEVEAGTYDLVLMDIQMPIMDGYEATRQIRALEDYARASVPIVAMTANAFEEDRQKAMIAGMDAHVAKPIDIPKLMEVLKEILVKE